MPEIERTCFDIRLLIDPLSLFFHFFPSSSLLVYIIPRNTLLFSFSSQMLDLLQLFTSRPRWKNFARKIWRNVGFRTEKSKKNEKLFGWWVSGIRTLDYFGGKTRTITTEPRKHSSIKLLFYLYQLHQFQVISR